MADRYTAPDFLVMAALASLALVLAALMAQHVTEGIPHLEDEIAYLFQARTFARGALGAPPPPDSRSFFIPFTLIVKHRWVGKYPIGWPLMLAVGERLGAGWLVNPMLGALLVALTYALGRDLFSREVGALAGLLALSSPFFLIQSSTYMSHAASALWFTALMWAGLHVETARESGVRCYGWSALSGAALGMLILTRPLTALGAAAPFGVVLLVSMVRQPSAAVQLARTYWPLALAGLALAAVQPLYLALATGSPTTNLYTLIWPYDRLGFGAGVGPYGGHTIRQGLITAWQDLRLWAGDLFGWPHSSWVPLVLGVMFGLREAKPKRQVWSIVLVAPFISLVIVHIAYWVGAQAYGPRYYYEAHAGLAITAALGLRGVVRWTSRLAGRLCRPADANQSLERLAWLLLAGLLAALLVLNVYVYLPDRLADWYALYGITSAPIDALDGLRQGERVLVFVRGRFWKQYGALFSLNNPWLDGPVVVAHDITPAINQAIAGRFPERDVWYYRAGVFSRKPFPYP